MAIRKKTEKIIGKVVNTVTGSVSQSSNKKAEAVLEPAEGAQELLRSAAAEGMVLLKNDNSVLPLSKGTVTAVFGRVQYDTFFVGYGSGGDVKAFHTVNIHRGLKNDNDIQLHAGLDEIYKKWIKENPADNGYWGHWPLSHEEMPVSDALVKRVSSESDCALVVIGRAAGEDRDNELTEGSYYLTEKEEKMLSAVSRYYRKWAVILNIGGIIDFSWIEKYKVPSVLIAWQGGMETGSALADILTGKVSPSGKLTDTAAISYDTYPSSPYFGGKLKNHYEEDIYVGYRYFETFDKNAVLFPFGHGLSYSDFKLHSITSEKTEDRFTVFAKVVNTGVCKAKIAVQLYFSAKNTVLDMPEMILCGFVKTRELAPGEEQDISLSVSLYTLCAYDDDGRTGYRSAYVLQSGEYSFALGFDIRNTHNAGCFSVKETVPVKQLSEICAPKREERLMRLRKLDNNGSIAKTFEPAPYSSIALKERISDHFPELLLNTKPDCTLDDVINRKASIEEFAASLSAAELEAISRGDYTMNSPLGPSGNAGVLAGVLPSLRNKGVPPVTCTDGPSGIRLSSNASLLPIGTALASTWNTELVEKLYAHIADEMDERKTDVLLAPGMNIHRNPLGGRNFEYFSEDPYLSGHIASAAVRGIQSKGAFACPKHFCCNNQEKNRTHNDSVVSERALREIYLKGFEICVTEAKPKVIMTSYNKINGVWGHYNYELVTEILRNEWGFDGCVITDWWMRPSHSPEFPKLRDQAYRVRAGVDVLMPGGDRTGKRRPDGTLLETLGETDGMTLNELQQTAIHILRLAILKKQKEL